MLRRGSSPSSQTSRSIFQTQANRAPPFPRVHPASATPTGGQTYAIYIKSRPGRGAFIEDISAHELDVATAPGGFLRVNLLSSGIQDPEPVPGDEGIPSAKNFSFTDVKVNCGTLVEAVSISPVKPVNGFSIVNVTGTCQKGIALANIVHAELRDIHVTGYEAPFLTQTNVQGIGLEEPKR